MRLPARERVKLVRSLQCVDAAVEAIDEDESVAETLRCLAVLRCCTAILIISTFCVARVILQISRIGKLVFFVQVLSPSDTNECSHYRKRSFGEFCIIPRSQLRSASSRYFCQWWWAKTHGTGVQGALAACWYTCDCIIELQLSINSCAHFTDFRPTISQHTTSTITFTGIFMIFQDVNIEFMLNHNEGGLPKILLCTHISIFFSCSIFYLQGVFRTGHSNGGWPGNSTAFVDALHAAL